LPDEPPPSPSISRYSRCKSAQNLATGRSFGSTPNGSLSSSAARSIPKKTAAEMAVAGMHQIPIVRTSWSGTAPT
jgi:hypothetical protein